MAAKVTKDLGVRLTADVKDLRRKLKSLEKDWDRYGRQVQKTNKRANAGRASMGGVGARGGGGMNRSIIAGGAAVAGSLGLVAAAKQAKQFEEQLVDLAVVGDKGRKWIARTRADVLKLSETWTKSPEEITAGMQAIIAATGDADLAAQSVGTLTKAAFASGAEVEELAKVATDLIGMLKLKPTDLTSVLDSIAQQANLGAIELKDMAQWFPVVLADLENFGWQGPKAAKGIGAFFQIAKRGNTNARNTAESIKIFTKMIAQNQAKLEKLLGVKLKKNGAWLQLPDLLKTIGQGYVDMEKKGKKGLQGKFGLLVGEGRRAINPVIAQARAGFGASVGGRASFNELLNPSGASGAINRMATARSELSPIHKWNVATAKLRAEMHRHMLPLLERFANLMPLIAKAGKFALDNSEQLFALWVSAKAAKFFSNLIGAGRIVSGGSSSGSGVVGGGGALGNMIRLKSGGYEQYDSPIGPVSPAQQRAIAARRMLGKGIRLGGKGAAVSGALGVGRGGFGGGAGERGVDAVATMAALAGGMPGAIIGGTYFLTKAAFQVAKAEIVSETLDFGKTKQGLDAAAAADILGGRFLRSTGKKKVTKEEQDKINSAAAAVARSKATLGVTEANVFGGPGGKEARAAFAKLSEVKQDLEASKVIGTMAPSFMDLGAEFKPNAQALATLESPVFKQLTAQSDEVKKNTAQLKKLQTQGFRVTLTEANIKQLGKAAVAAARAEQGRIKN